MALLRTLEGQTSLAERGYSPQQGTRGRGRQISRRGWLGGGGSGGEDMRGGQGLVEVGGDNRRGGGTWRSTEESSPAEHL